MSVSCGADGFFQTSPHNLVLSRFRRARHFAPRPFFVFTSAAFR